MMENYLNQENFNSSTGVTFEEYPTSSKTQDFLGNFQTFPGAANNLSSSSEESAFPSLTGNMANTQYGSSNETLPTINEATNYETLGTNNSEVSLEKYQNLDSNIASSTDTTNYTHILPSKYLPLITQNLNSNKQAQNLDIVPSSSDILNTFQSSSSNNDEISLGNFQTPTVETNSQYFGEVDNALQGTNQGELAILPTEYSSEMNKNQAFEFNDFKTTSSIEPEASLQLQGTDTITNTNIEGSSYDANHLNLGVSTNEYEAQTSNSFEGNYDTNALSSGITTNDMGSTAQTIFDNYQINSSTVDTGISLADYQNTNMITNTTTSTTGFDTVATPSVENL